MSNVSYLHAADFPRVQGADLRSRFAIWRKRAAAYRKTVRELSQMTDRELADIGLHRANIRDVALEAASLAVRG